MFADEVTAALDTCDHGGTRVDWHRCGQLGRSDVVDVSLPESGNISGALVVAPFLVSSGARPAIVAVVGFVAAIDGLYLAFNDGSGIHASAARLVVIILGTVVADPCGRPPAPEPGTSARVANGG